MPLVSKKALERIEKQRKLLHDRRNPKKGRVQKFHKRMMEYAIEIQTESLIVDGKARDLPFRVQAQTSLDAVRLALTAYEERAVPTECIHVIHVGEGKWIEREGIGQ